MTWRFSAFGSPWCEVQASPWRGLHHRPWRAHALRPTEPERFRGFSLLELLVVLGITAAVMTLIVPRFVQTVESARFRAAVREVVSGLRQARGIALLQRREATFYLDVEEKFYRVDRLEKRRLPSALELEVETAKQDLTDTGGTIRFFPDGSSTGGRITLAWGQRRREIDVNWLTGRVEMRK